MPIDIGRLIDIVSAAVIAAEAELTALDSAIGDGDHGANMKRGFEAIRDDRARLAGLSLPDALKAAGMVLVMKVGGASGPLYGTLIMTLGKEMPGAPGLEEAADAFAAAVEAVKARGKSDTGAKTLLDVLVPVRERLGAPNVDCAALRQTASAAAEATIPMRATRGRASFLGERSIGHMDPGARSSQILLHAVCDALEQA